MAGDTVNGSASLVEAHLVRPQGVSNGVLLVEDDVVIVDLLRDVLAGAGFEVHTAANAEDALEQFRRFHHEVIGVVLDYEIPGMHSRRLLERFLEIDSEVKVILSSGYPQSIISRDFPLDKLFSFLPKPYDPQLLVLELRELARRLPVF